MHTQRHQQNIIYGFQVQTTHSLWGDLPQPKEKKPRLIRIVRSIIPWKNVGGLRFKKILRRQEMLIRFCLVASFSFNPSKFQKLKGKSGWEHCIVQFLRSEANACLENQLRRDSCSQWIGWLLYIVNSCFIFEITLLLKYNCLMAPYLAKKLGFKISSNYNIELVY